MNLGIFLALGDSFIDMKKSGQDVRFKEFYLKRFAQHFDQIYIFSYANESVDDLPSNVKLVPNRFNLHRFLYGLLLPLINFPEIRSCAVFRSYHLTGTVPALMTKIIFNKPFVYNYAYNYQQFAEIEGKKFQIILYQLIEPLANRFADIILAANQNILKKLPRKTVRYLPNGIDTNVFTPAKTKQSNTQPIILTVGRLENQKNYQNLIMALKGLKVKLIIVGDGSLKRNLSQLAKRCGVIYKNIPRVDNTKLVNVYQQADIFVLPSLAEGHSKVLLEAMSCGLPVVASQVEGNTDIVIHNKNGLLTGITSDEIRESVIKLVSDQKARNRFGLEARKTIVKNFKLKNLLEKEIAILASLTKG